MSSSFPRTVEALRIDRFGGSLLVLLLVGALSGVWVVWFSLARITRYEVTASARVEIDQETHAIQSPVLARVEESHLTLGRQVEAGDTLVVLDGNSERLQVEEERKRLAGIEPQIDVLRAQIAKVEQSREHEQQSTQAALEEAQAKYREADALARQAEADAARLDQLRAEGLAAGRDAEQARFQAESRKHAAEALRLDTERLRREQHTRESDRNVQLTSLQGQIEKLESDRHTSLATIQRIAYEIERRIIRAPVAGQIAEAAPLRPGTVVDEAEKLGAIVPAGKLRVVAQFPPAAALGRIRVGQPALVRLDGFPWTQYGSIAATVSRVAGEVRDGAVRVELAMLPRDPSAAPRVPLQHGLPGSVEIEVERLTPAALLLRTAGSMWAAPRSAFPESARTP
jgi:membrane fusion protein (multidrug efflux system)